MMTGPSRTGSTANRPTIRPVARTLLRRLDKLVFDPYHRYAEIKHVKSVLRENGYKPWTFTIPRKQPRGTSTSSPWIPLVCISYTQDVSKHPQRVFKSNGVPSYHKPDNVLRSLLVRAKYKAKKKTDHILRGNASTRTSVKRPGLGGSFQRAHNGYTPKLSSL